MVEIISPNDRIPRKKRTFLTYRQKCEIASAYGYHRHVDLATHYGISHETVKNVWSNREKYRQVAIPNIQAPRSLRDTIEDALILFGRGLEIEQVAETLQVSPTYLDAMLKREGYPASKRNRLLFNPQG